MLSEPFEFIALGLPVGHQAAGPRKAAWKALVRNDAAQYWKNRSSPIAQSLQVTIVHYYSTIPVGDTDNLVKPILDALIGLVYVDDSFVTDVVCRRRRMDTRYCFPVVEPAPNPTVLKP